MITGKASLRTQPKSMMAVLLNAMKEPKPLDNKMVTRQ